MATNDTKVHRRSSEYMLTDPVVNNSKESNLNRFSTTYIVIYIQLNTGSRTSFIVEYTAADSGTQHG